MHPPAGQPPQQEAVHRAEREPPVLCRRPRARHLVQHPADLGGREVRVEPQPGARRHQRAVPRRLQRLAAPCGAPVLPDDRVADRPPAVALPQHGGLALVGDAEPGQLGRAQPSARQRLARGGQHGVPQRLRVVLHPARPRGELGELALRRGQRQQVLAEHDGTAGGGALIDHQDARHHGASERCGRKDKSARPGLCPHLQDGDPPGAGAPGPASVAGHRPRPGLQGAPGSGGRPAPRASLPSPCWAAAPPSS